MAEEDAQVGVDIAVNVKQQQQQQQKHPPDAGGGGERILKQKQQQPHINNNNNKKISQPVEVTRKSETKFIMGSSNSNKKKKQQQQQRIVKDIHNIGSDSEEGFLSTSPDSANGEVMDLTANNVNSKILLKHINNCNGDENSTNNIIKNLTTTTTTATTTTTIMTTKSKTEIGESNNNNNKISPLPQIYQCTNSSQCVTLKNILDSFKAALSEEQAWALIYQFMSLYRNFAKASVTSTGERHIFNELELPDTLENLNLHRDGTVHCSWSEADFKIKEEKIQEQKLQQQQQQSQCDEQEEERGK